MFFAVVETKDKGLGVVIISDDIDEIIGELLLWRVENNISYKAIPNTKLIHKESGMELGDIIFEKNGVVFDPHVEAVN